MSFRDYKETVTPQYMYITVQVVGYLDSKVTSQCNSPIPKNFLLKFLL